MTRHTTPAQRDAPPAQPLAAGFAEGLERYRAALQEAFPALWERVLREVTQPAPVARVWSIYNEGYLLRAGRPDAPVIAFDLVASRRLGAAGQERLLERLPPVALLLVTHRHGDHLDGEVVTRLLDQGATVAMPAEAYEALRQARGWQETPRGLKVVRAGDCFYAAEAAVRVHAADHRSGSLRDSVAYGVVVDGLTIVHAADHRAFDSHVADWPRQADLLIVSLFCEQVEQPGAAPGLAGMAADAAWIARLSWDQQAALIPFIDRLSPRRVVLGHLYELGHEPEKLFRFVDAGVVREALFARAPQIGVWIPAPGECLPLLPTPVLEY